MSSGQNKDETATSARSVGKTKELFDCQRFVLVY